MNMRDYYEKLDPYDLYNKKDVVNAYKHGEDDAIDKILEIIDEFRRHIPLNSAIGETCKAIRKEILTLKGGEG